MVLHSVCGLPLTFFSLGLLGDATEDMVEQLDSGKGENVDEEEVYKMARVLSECGGLEAILSRLGLHVGACHGGGRGRKGCGFGIKDWMVLWTLHILCRLNHARDFIRCHELVSAALKLLGYCVKLKVRSLSGFIFLLGMKLV